MRSGGLIILVFLVWMIVGLWAFAKTKSKSSAAVQAALYIVSYPAIIVLFVQLKPVPLVIAIPLVMAGVPWLLAGSHLQKVSADPSAAKPGEFIGLPLKLWGWGLALSIGIGALF